MLCEKCSKNEATVYYRENVNGKEKKYALCADCAKKLEANGEISLNSFRPQDELGVFNSIFKNFFAPNEHNDAQIPETKRCPLCSSSFNELVKDGRVGCALCYDTFSAELERTISNIHSNAVHCGKSPSKFRGKLDVKRKIRALESELKEAIKDERFERAAQIRDELNSIRGQ
jgi:protein arginine kinase activator